MNINLLNKPHQITEYLKDKGLFCGDIAVTPINNGASGAKLYLIIDKYNHYVIKQTHKLFYGNDTSKVLLYNKELKFYSLLKESTLSFIPKTVYMEDNSDFGMILVFPYYERIDSSFWNHELQLKAIDVCAKLHSLDTQLIKDLDIEHKNIFVDPKDCNNSLKAWTNLIKLESYYDKQILNSIYENIEIICKILNGQPFNICHGDFHADNIMLNNSDLVICDWQDVGYGKGAGDLSFFISRGKASGIYIQEAELINYYCERLAYYKKTEVNKEDIYIVLNASTVYVSFIFWAYYLKNMDSSKISEIYNKMVNSFKLLNL